MKSQNVLSFPKWIEEMFLKAYLKRRKQVVFSRGQEFCKFALWHKTVHFLEENVLWRPRKSNPSPITREAGVIAIEHFADLQNEIWFTQFHSQRQLLKVSINWNLNDGKAEDSYNLTRGFVLLKLQEDKTNNPLSENVRTKLQQPL